MATTDVNLDSAGDDDRKYRAPALEKGLDALDGFEILIPQGHPLVLRQAFTIAEETPKP